MLGGRLVFRCLFWCLWLIVAVNHNKSLCCHVSEGRWQHVLIKCLNGGTCTLWSVRVYVCPLASGHVDDLFYPSIKMFLKVVSVLVKADDWRIHSCEKHLQGLVSFVRIYLTEPFTVRFLLHADAHKCLRGRFTTIITAGTNTSVFGKVYDCERVLIIKADWNTVWTFHVWLQVTENSTEMKKKMLNFKSVNGLAGIHLKTFYHSRE